MQGPEPAGCGAGVSLSAREPGGWLCWRVGLGRSQPLAAEWKPRGMKTQGETESEELARKPGSGRWENEQPWCRGKGWVRKGTRGQYLGATGTELRVLHGAPRGATPAPQRRGEQVALHASQQNQSNCASELAICICLLGFYRTRGFVVKSYLT